jgi:hypothetical protein
MTADAGVRLARARQMNRQVRLSFPTVSLGGLPLRKLELPESV